MNAADIVIGQDIMVMKDESGLGFPAVVSIVSASVLNHPSGVSHRVIVTNGDGHYGVGYVVQRGSAKPRVMIREEADFHNEFAISDSADRDWN